MSEFTPTHDEALQVLVSLVRTRSEEQRQQLLVRLAELRKTLRGEA